MSGRRAIVALCMLCTLAFSATAVQNASAATKGTTLFTCKKKAVEGGAGFSREHCASADVVSTGAKFEHVAIAENTTTEITGTSEDTEGKPTESKLKSVASGVELEIVSPLTHILYENAAKEKSWATNAKDPTTGEHYYHGEATVTYTAPKVTKPAEKGCKVKEEDITTKKLKFTTKGQVEHTVLFEPASGTVFAEFNIEGCTIAALNGLYKVEGSVKGTADGATLTFDHNSVTAQGLLKLRGQKAGFSSTVTVKGTDKAAGDVTDTPLSSTTVETP